MTRAEWLQARSQSVGASEAAALFSLHPYHSPYSLWAEKTGQVEPPEESTDLQELGLVIEPYLRKRYERETGRRVVTLPPHTVYRIAQVPATATPDGMVDYGPRVPGGELGVLELKNAGHFSANDELPAHWQIQVQQQLLCTDLQRGSMAILGAFAKFHTVDVERNNAFIRLLVEKIEEFWDYVKRGTPPPVDGHAATTEALRRLHPKDNGAVVTLAPEAEQWTGRLTIVEQNIKQLEAEERALKNYLLAAIGPATYGRLPDGSGWALKTTSRAGYSVEPSEYRALRRAKKLPT